MSGTRIDVADLLTHPGSRREVRLDAPVDGLSGSAADVTGPVGLHVVLERIPEGIVVRGTVTARWDGACSRCLRDLEEELSLHVDELFEADSVEGETYPIEGHELDLEQLLRDTILLELPLAPHCAQPCVEARPAEPEQPVVDARWSVLSELDL
jgi:uncharacterized protein